MFLNKEKAKLLEIIHMKMTLITTVPLALLTLGTEIRAQMGRASEQVEFRGTASGGVLTLSNGFGRRNPYISIETQTGESSNAAAQHLIDVAHGSGPDLDLERVVLGDRVLLELLGSSGHHWFGGTESGLGIPRAPHSLTAMADFASGTIKLTWANPVGGYDEIRVLTSYWPAIRVMPGDSTSVVLTDVRTLNPSETDVRIIGYKGADNPIPSNIAQVRVRHGYQDEMVDTPFTDNVMPNWVAWSLGSGQGNIQLLEGRKTEVGWNSRLFIDDPGRKYFYQLIGCTQAGSQGGIWRKFLGLTPGHTYKVSVRMNTLAMGGDNGDWWFSAHAAQNGTGGGQLTPDQMAGLAVLPDGSSGPHAGQFAKYGGSVTTNGKWVARSTADSGPGDVIGNITLPEGVTVITVWLKHGSNTGPSTGVGMDWVALEDVTGH